MSLLTDFFEIKDKSDAEIFAQVLTQDGAGSGLDADLLDGQQGSYYLAASAYTAADVLAKLLTVDGPATGLDADLLDGNQAADFVAATSYTAADVLAKLLTVDGSGSGLDADLLDGNNSDYFLPAGSYTAADVFAKVLTQDGAGSGLDADTLDGQQASYFLAATAYTAADVLAKLLTVDGAASGLDADLLDGQHGSYYYPASNPNGYTSNVGDVTSVSAGAGLDGGGTSGAVTLTHSDTSSQGSVNNSGNTVIQDITLDGYGHITNINSKALSIPSAQSTRLGAVGTYALLRTTATSGSHSPGTTRAGSGLDYASASGDYVSTSPSGTWRCMGYCVGAIGGADRQVTIWVRIS